MWDGFFVALPHSPLANGPLVFVAENLHPCEHERLSLERNELVFSSQALNADGLSISMRSINSSWLGAGQF